MYPRGGKDLEQVVLASWGIGTHAQGSALRYVSTLATRYLIIQFVTAEEVLGLGPPTPFFWSGRCHKILRVYHKSVVRAKQAAEQNTRLEAYAKEISLTKPFLQLHNQIDSLLVETLPTYLSNYLSHHNNNDFFRSEFYHIPTWVIL